MPARHALPTPSATPPTAESPPGERKKKTNLIKSSHRLISTANLQLKESRLIPLTVGRRARHAALLRIAPGPGPAKDVLALLLGEVLARIDGHVDGVLVGARAALEPVAARVHPGEDEQVGAVGADFMLKERMLVHLREVIGKEWGG